MTNLRKMAKSVQNLCFGLGAIVCALACGAGDEGAPAPAGGPDSPRMDEPDPELSPACDDNPLAKACSPQPQPPMQPQPQIEPPPRGPVEAERARARSSR